MSRAATILPSPILAIEQDHAEAQAAFEAAQLRFEASCAACHQSWFDLCAAHAVRMETAGQVTTTGLDTYRVALARFEDAQAACRASYAEHCAAHETLREARERLDILHNWYRAALRWQQ